jgi:hypothetical protein
MKKLITISLTLCIALLCYAPTLLKPIDSRGWSSPKPTEQTSEQINAHFLRQTLDELVKLDCYRPHGGFTYCNIGSKDALDNRPSPWGKHYGFMLSDLSLNLTPIWPTVHSMWSYSIKEDYQSAKRAILQGHIERVTCRQAFDLAKRGEVIFIISIKYNHEAIAYPDSRPWNEYRGCRIANVGKWNVITDMSHLWTFGKNWKDEEILYVHLTRRGE